MSEGFLTTIRTNLIIPGRYTKVLPHFLIELKLLNVKVVSFLTIDMSCVSDWTVVNWKSHSVIGWMVTWLWLEFSPGTKTKLYKILIYISWVALKLAPDRQGPSSITFFIRHPNTNSHLNLLIIRSSCHGAMINIPARLANIKATRH